MPTPDGQITRRAETASSGLRGPQVLISRPWIRLAADMHADMHGDMHGDAPESAQLATPVASCEFVLRRAA